MGKAAGIYHNETIRLGPGVMNAFDQRSFMVALEAFKRDPIGLRQTRQSLVDVLKRLGAVDVRFARSQEIQVGPMQDENLPGWTSGR